jgi:hypothetical protein
MSYEECLEKVKNCLVKYTETEIKQNCQDSQFKMWIELDSGHEFGHKYVNTFKEIFGDYVKNEDADVIYTTGNQIGFLLRALVEANIEEPKIIKIAKTFVSAQIEDFGNWCGDVCLRMPESEDENQDEPT